MKKQIVIIHGGGTFDTYGEYIKYLEEYKFDSDDLKQTGWKRTLEERLGEDFEVIAPRMPSSSNAKYLEWKIWFDKFIPFLKDNVVLIGHSLGGIFLAKYLSENEFPKKIRAVFLISAPYEDKNCSFSLADFKLPESLALFERQGGEIHLYHSEDDKAVSFGDIEKYGKVLPEAELRIFKDRGHFIQEEFPELVDEIKNLYNAKN